MVFRLLMLPLPPNSAMVTAVAVLGEAELAADLPLAVADLVLQLLLLAVGLLEALVLLGVDLGELPQLAFQGAQLTLQLVGLAPLGPEGFADRIRRRIATDGFLVLQLLVVEVFITQVSVAAEQVAVASEGVRVVLLASRRLVRPLLRLIEADQRRWCRS